MNEWSKEQIKVVMQASVEADGGCCYCIQAVLKEFLRLTSWDLLDVMDEIGNDVDFDYYNWEDCRPEIADWEIELRRKELAGEE